MAEKNDRNVPLTPVRYADRATRAHGLSLPAPRRAARVAELRLRVNLGIYATESMMDNVARMILRSGDL
jgi:hypothetical protein